MSDEMWNDERECADTIEVPAWIEQDITWSTVAAIVQGGCASGAYMPAVTYYEAAKTMAEHGDEVLEYLNDVTGELPSPPADESWSGMACHFLSTAVEWWAMGAADGYEGETD